MRGIAQATRNAALVAVVVFGLSCSGNTYVPAEAKPRKVEADPNGQATAAPSPPPPATTAPRSSVDVAPSWYTGSKPWNEIGLAGREEILRMRAAFEAQKSVASQPGAGAADPKMVEKGQRVIDRIVRQYHLPDVYREPDNFGPRMVIWLPETAWAGLSQTDKSSIETYMASKYANWGIGVGRVQNHEVLYDRLVVEH